MSRIPLLGGAYSARSIIASAQSCKNLFPEKTPESTTPPTPVIQYLTPGIVELVQPGPDNSRCAYTATNGDLFVAIGNSVFYIDSSFNETLVGIVTNADTPSFISDNGTVAVLVDGTSTGYVWDLATHTFAAIADPAFYGADRVACIDGWFCFNRPGTNQFYLSPNNWDGATPFDPLYIASKTGGPDRIVSLGALRGELWLVGLYTTEVWFNSGGADFPFSRQAGVLIEHGALAPWSLATMDVNLFWLGQDQQGRCIVFMGRGYEAVRVSNSALEEALQISVASTLADAVAYTYQQAGHAFYVISFPSLDQTWAYDLLTGEWHERTWTNPANGTEHRHRGNVGCFAYNRNVVCDWEIGKVYWLTTSAYTDDGDPIMRRRGYPHVVNDDKRMSHSAFILDMDVDRQGVAYTGTPTVYVRWSDTRGATWSTPIGLIMGYADPNPEYRSLVIRRLGMARDRVYEVYWDFALPTALQGAWIEVEASAT